MTRLLTALGLAAGAVAALLLWASSRDLREPWRWPAIPTPEPDDDIQPPDPVTLQPVVVTLPTNLSPTEVGHIRGWLTDHPDVLAELYEAKPVPSYLHPST